MYTPFDEIPDEFVLSTITEHQKKSIQIKYYIKQAIDEWKAKPSHSSRDTKGQLYQNLTEVLPLGLHSIEKLAKKL
jgi:hypothetical protein